MLYRTIILLDINALADHLGIDRSNSITKDSEAWMPELRDLRSYIRKRQALSDPARQGVPGLNCRELS